MKDHRCAGGLDISIPGFSGPVHSKLGRGLFAVRDNPRIKPAKVFNRSKSGAIRNYSVTLCQHFSLHLRPFYSRSIIPRMIKIDLDTHLNGRSLNWLSVQTGIRWPTLRAMQDGKAQRVELSALEKLSKALACEPADLIVSVPRTRKR